MRRCFVSLAALGLLLLGGCEQTQTTLYINPDGTGKLLYVATYPLDIESPGTGKAKPRTDDQKAALALKSVLDTSVGVEAWSGVSCTATPDGLILFKGTAYFRDLASLKIGSLTGADGNGLTVHDGQAVHLAYTKTARGYRIAVVEEQHAKPEDQAIATDNKPRTREALLQSVRRARTNWKYARPMLSVIVGNNVRAYTVISPRPAKAVRGFTQTRDGYAFTFDGGKLLKAMDDLFAKSDGDLAALAGQVELKDSQALMAYVGKPFGFDPQSEPSLEIETDAPLFDYAGELAAARTAFATLCAKAGATAPGLAGQAPAAPASKATLKRVRVKSIRRTFAEDGQEDEGAVIHQNENTTIELSVAFDGAVTALGKVAITELTDANGRTCTNKDLTCNGNLAQDQTSGTLSCNLPSDLAAIGRLAGTLAYSVGSGSKIVDLGIIEIRKGAQGTALEAEIVSADGGWLHLKFTGDPALVKAVRVLTAEGQPYKVSEFQLSGWQGSCTKTLRPGEGDTWPDKLRFQVELFTESKAFTASWSVQDIALPHAGK